MYCSTYANSAFYNKYKRRLFHLFIGVSIIIFVIGSIIAFQQDQEQKALLDNLTGGDSFPVIVPQNNTGVIPLVIWNHGKYVLNGVKVSIRDCEFVSGIPKKENVGVLSQGQPYELTSSLNPQSCSRYIKIDGKDVASYWIDMSAQNGRYIQILQFMRDDKCNSWSYRYGVERVQPVDFSVENNFNKTEELDEDTKKYMKKLDETKGWVGHKLCQ